jgi:hypothetical protein
MPEPIDDPTQTETKVETDMISGTSQVSSMSPPETTLRHMMSGAHGQIATCIQNSPEDLKDFALLSRARKFKYGMRLFLFAPGPNVDGKPVMTTEFFLTVAWPAAAAIFGVPPGEAVIFKHEPQRETDREHDHFHVGVCPHDPVTGHSRSWSWDRAKLERFSRTMEVLTNSPILLGRFQPSVIRELRKMGEDAVADAIEKAHAPGEVPAGRTPKRQIEQSAKKKNINLRETDKDVREAFAASVNQPTPETRLAAFRKALTGKGLSLEVSNRVAGRPAWVIHKDGQLVRSLGGCFPPKTTITSIIKQIGEPTHERHPEELEQLDLIDAIDAAAQPGGGDPEVRENVGRDVEMDGVRHAQERRADLASDGADAGKREAFARVFVEEVVNSFTTAEINELEQRADRIMISPLFRCLEYFRDVITKAKAFLDRIMPKPSDFLINSQKNREEAEKASDASEAAAADYAEKVSTMKKAPAPPFVGAKAHKERLAEAERELANKNRLAQIDKLNHADSLKVAGQFENYHAEKVKEVVEEYGAKIQAANHRINVAKRVDIMLEVAPEVALMGPRAILYQGLKYELAPEPTKRLKPSDPDDDEPTYTAH